MEGSSQAHQDFKKYQYKIINGKYKIGHIFDSGNYGHLFYAEDQNTKPYAIKMIDMAQAQKNSKLKQLLNQQPFIMKACNNDHIMKCHAAFECKHQKIKVIVMDYCQSGNLEQFIFLRVRLPQYEARVILKQLLYSLGEFHRHGFIHRDIKSANFCIKGKNIILTDFGSSKYFSNQNSIFNWRKTFKINGTVLGTKYYESPQMIQGVYYGLRTDLWGIGIIFYEMLTGITPFDFQALLSSKQILDKIKLQIKDIYRPQYIRQRLKKAGYTFSQNQCKISTGAQQFLQKLLTIDQNSRIGWKQLLISEYLIENKSQVLIPCYQKPECSFPFKDIDWNSVFNQYNNQMKAHDYQFKKAESSQPLPDIEVLSQLQKQERICLNKRFNTLYTLFLQNLQQLGELHFQIRKIHLLLVARQQLSKFDEAQIKLGAAISNYCYLKLGKIEEFKNKISQQLTDGFKIQMLKDLIESTQLIDKNSLLAKGEGFYRQFLYTMKYYFRGPDAHQKYVLLSQGKDYEKTIEIICSYSDSLCKSLDEQKLKCLRQKYCALKELVEHPKLLLTCQYKSRKQVHSFSKNYQWKSWKDLRYIRKCFIK